MQGLFKLFHACKLRPPFFTIFWNFVYPFFAKFQIFWTFLPFFSTFSQKSYKCPFFLESGPNKGCFSGRWPLLGMRKSAPKKLTIFFQISSMCSSKAHAHYFTVFIYLPTWSTAKLGIFTLFTFTILPRCRQSMNSLLYEYPIHIPSCFSEYLITVVITLFCTTATQKDLLYYPLRIGPELIIYTYTQY